MWQKISHEHCESRRDIGAPHSKDNQSCTTIACTSLCSKYSSLSVLLLSEDVSQQTHTTNSCNWHQNPQNHCDKKSGLCFTFRRHSSDTLTDNLEERTTLDPCVGAEGQFNECATHQQLDPCESCTPYIHNCGNSNWRNKSKWCVSGLGGQQLVCCCFLFGFS